MELTEIATVHNGNGDGVVLQNPKKNKEEDWRCAFSREEANMAKLLKTVESQQQIIQFLAKE